MYNQEERNVALVIVFLTFVLMLAIVGGTYAWRSTLAAIEYSSQVQVNELHSELIRLRHEISELKHPNTLVTPVPGSYIKVVSPNGGERICLGSVVPIEWESQGVKIVKVTIRAGGTTYYTLGEYPATFSETGERGKGSFDWKAGVTKSRSLPEGYTYEVLLSSGDAGPPYSDTSDDPFSLVRCEG
jgi:hypothetical protein